MATTSKEINLRQLDEELGGQGLVADFNDFNNKLILPAEHSTVTEQELEAAIESHIAIAYPEPSVAEKLASVGLSLEELREALGSN